MDSDLTPIEPMLAHIRLRLQEAAMRTYAYHSIQVEAGEQPNTVEVSIAMPSPRYNLSFTATAESEGDRLMRITREMSGG